jgi:hypothetical protein
MLGLDVPRLALYPPLLDPFHVRNRLPAKQMNRNHMKTAAAWISRQRFSSLLDPQAM